MRHISFALTTQQFRDQTKTVTRRLGWEGLTAGTLLMGCEKCMGLRKGEKVNRLGVIRVLSVRREVLDTITEAEVEREGFPGMSPEEFVAMFCRHNNSRRWTSVTRIEFEYVYQPKALSGGEEA